jgi:isopentenyldiphosphate isomerase
MSEELLQLVDRAGNPAGRARRSECHGNPDLIQAVVHLYIFDSSGRLYLQKRASGKDRFPGRWDSSVGGHVSPGETWQQAIRREAREELGIDLDGSGWGGEPLRLERLPPHLYGDEVETEYVFCFRLIYDGAFTPNSEEVEEGAFFEVGEIRRLLHEEPSAFTPHFRVAFERLLGSN